MIESLTCGPCPPTRESWDCGDARAVRGPGGTPCALRAFRCDLQVGEEAIITDAWCGPSAGIETAARVSRGIAAARARFKVNGWRSKCLGRSNQARWARRCNRAWVDAAGIVAKNARLACWDRDGRAGRNDTCNVMATVLYPICQSDGATPQRNLHIIVMGLRVIIVCIALTTVGAHRHPRRMIALPSAPWIETDDCAVRSIRWENVSKKTRQRAVARGCRRPRLSRALRSVRVGVTAHG